VRPGGSVILISSAAWDIGLSLVYGVLATCAALACASGLGRLVVGAPSVWCNADREPSRRTGVADMLGLDEERWKKCQACGHA